MHRSSGKRKSIKNIFKINMPSHKLVIVCFLAKRGRLIVVGEVLYWEGFNGLRKFIQFGFLTDDSGSPIE